MRTFALSWRTHTGRAVAASLISMGFLCESAYAGLERGVTNGVPYAVGGWSIEARQELTSLAAGYSVMLVFARSVSGEYLADVKVSVRDTNGGEVLALDHSGPIVLLGLAAGNYLIELDHNGLRHTRMITVGAQTHRQVVFYWPGDTSLS